jgi:hypothetical protein
MARYRFLGFATALVFGGLAFSGLAGSALAGQPSITQTQSSSNYRVELDIGPAATMLTPDQAMTATSGEVMVETPNMAPNMSMGAMGMSMPGMSMAGMSMGSMSMPAGASAMSMMQMATTDDGQPVNHHLEVHVYDIMTGAVIANPVPSITITDNTTGATRTLADVMGMYDVQTGTSDLHFGNNVYLKDGDTYTIQVMEGSDMVTFANIVPSGGMGLPASAGSSMAPMSMPAGMPSP